MIYLIQRWRQWRCAHNYKYAMRISSGGFQWRCYECEKCYAMKYEKIPHSEEDEVEFKDLGKP